MKPTASRLFFDRGAGSNTGDRVLCSAGKRGWDISPAPLDLITLTGAATADIRAV